MMMFFTTMNQRKQLVFFFIFSFSLISMACSRSQAPSFPLQDYSVLGVSYLDSFESFVYNTRCSFSIVTSFFLSPSRCGAFILDTRFDSNENPVKKSIKNRVDLATWISFKNPHMHLIMIHFGIFMAVVAVFGYISTQRWRLVRMRPYRQLNMPTNGFEWSSLIMCCGASLLGAVYKAFLSFGTIAAVRRSLLELLANHWEFLKLLSRGCNVASVLGYLHQERDERVIHKDSKSNNQRLLDGSSNDEAREIFQENMISDFKRGPPSQEGCQHHDLYGFAANGILHHMDSRNRLIHGATYKSHSIREVYYAFPKFNRLPFPWVSRINHYSSPLGKFIWERWASFSNPERTCFPIVEEDPTSNEEIRFQHPVKDIKVPKSNIILDEIPQGIVSRVVQIFESTQVSTKYPVRCTSSNSAHSRCEEENRNNVSLHTGNMREEMTSLSHKEAKRNLTSFIAILEQKQEAATLCTGNRNVKVKALLDAAKCDEQGKGTQALNLEQARIDQKQNARRLELNKKEKKQQHEEKHKKRDAGRRQRVEDERKQMAKKRNYNMKGEETTISKMMCYKSGKGKPAWRP